jgi:hypothetical protein
MSPAVCGIITRRILVNYSVEIGSLDEVLLSLSRGERWRNQEKG